MSEATVVAPASSVCELSARGRSAHDPPSIEIFIGDHYQRLLRTLERHTSHSATSEDLAQEALIKLLEHWSTVSAMTHPWLWLRTVAINLTISQWRRTNAAERVVDDLRTQLASDRGTDSSESDLIDLLDCVARLPERQRDAVLLRHYGHFSVEETADAIGCAAGTVKSLTHRGLSQLQTDLTNGTLANGALTDGPGIPRAAQDPQAA